MISCIVTSFGKKEFLGGCLDSILANLETYDNGIEIIIIDDKSIDGSLQLAQEYAKKYPSVIKLLVNEKNIGAGASRNKGVKYATGKWISFIDADDYIANDFYKTLVELANNNDADMVYGTYCALIGNDYSEKHIQHVLYPNTLLDDMEVASLEMPKYQLQFLNVAITKRELYSNGIEYCPSRFIEDTPTALCLFTNAKRIFVSDYCGYFYRQIGSSLIHSASKAKHLVFLLYNMEWATKIISEKNAELSQKLKEMFSDEIYSECCLYRIDAEDLKKVSVEMWDKVKEYYSADEKRMLERKNYALKNMSKVIKIS